MDEIKIFRHRAGFGIQPFDQTSRGSLLEVIEDRHGKRSTIITSQLPVSKWHDVIGKKQWLMQLWTVSFIMHSAWS